MLCRTIIYRTHWPSLPHVGSTSTGLKVIASIWFPLFPAAVPWLLPQPSNIAMPGRNKVSVVASWCLDTASSSPRRLHGPASTGTGKRTITILVFRGAPRQTQQGAYRIYRYQCIITVTGLHACPVTGLAL